MLINRITLGRALRRAVVLQDLPLPRSRMDSNLGGVSC